MFNGCEEQHLCNKQQDRAAVTWNISHTVPKAPGKVKGHSYKT